MSSGVHKHGSIHLNNRILQEPALPNLVEFVSDVFLTGIGLLLPVSIIGSLAGALHDVSRRQHDPDCWLRMRSAGFCNAFVGGAEMSFAARIACTVESLRRQNSGAFKLTISCNLPNLP